MVFPVERSTGKFFRLSLTRGFFSTGKFFRLVIVEVIHRLIAGDDFVFFAIPCSLFAVFFGVGVRGFFVACDFGVEDDGVCLASPPKGHSASFGMEQAHLSKLGNTGSEGAVSDIGFVSKFGLAGEAYAVRVGFVGYGYEDLELGVLDVLSQGPCDHF